MTVAAAVTRALEAGDLGRILIVDDDDGMRETLAEILSASGLHVAAVGTGAEALAVHLELAPAVVLVDHRLPDANGIDLGALLKRRDADVTVLLVTGYASLDNAIAAVGELDGFLTKPVPPAELLRVVRAGVERARLRRENRALVEDLRQANLRLEQGVATRTRELSGLLALSESLARSPELQDVFDACLRTAQEVTRSRYTGLYLEDGDTGEFVLRARTGEGLLPDRLPRLTLETAAGPETLVPLRAGGRVVGSLLLGVADPVDAMFLTTLAGSAAIAIQNAERLGREQETVERLSELSRLKSTFLAQVSHELRNPLTAVIGYAELLRRGFESDSPERQADMLAAIIEQSRALSSLVDDLVDAARAEFGGFRMTLDTVDASSVIARVERLFGEAANRVVVRLAPDLPKVHGNGPRLEQVLSNLVANAVKHSPPDAVVELRADLEGDRVRLSVVDAGSGIAPEFLPHLFDPFTQGGLASAQRDGGLGLGLYIVRGLVEAMGGTVEAHSRLGHGSEFVVRLWRAVDTA